MPTLNTEIEKPSAAIGELQAENDELRLRLQEAEETLAAIRSGAVDALVVEEPAGHRIYTLEGADRPYRLFVEEMQQGAATLHADGTIAWCNRQLAEMIKTAPEKLIGTTLHDFVSPESRAVYDNLLWQGKTHSGRGQAQLRRTDGGLVPAYFTFNSLPKDCGAAIGVLVTDQTSLKHHEELTAAHAALRESEKRLEVELAATRQLQSLSALLIEAGNPEALYQRIVDAAVSIMGSDFASLQMHLPEGNAGEGELLLLAHHGFAPESIETFRWVRTNTGCTCGETLRTGARTIASDVEQASYIVGRPGLQAYRQSNIRAVQTTPLVCRTDGRILGMISTHWRNPHMPTETDLRKLDVLARQAADLLERNETEQVLRESERRFREMIDALPVAIYTTDAEGRLTHFNPAAVEFSGRTPELGSGQWCVSFKLFHPDGTPLPHDECPMAIALKEGRIIRGVEAIAERPDGHRRWFTPYPTPLRDSTGKIVGGINLLLDITERKQAEEARAKLAAIVDSSDDAIISKTLEGVVTSWNAGAERLLGYRAEEILGQPAIAVIPPDRRSEEAEILARLRRDERVEHFETVRMAKDGRRVEVSLSISPVRDGSGRLIGTSKIMRDITERRRTEEKLRQAAEFDEAVMANMGEGLYTVDKEGRVTFMNTAAEKLFGWTSAELAGRRMHEVTHFKHSDGTPFPAEDCAGFQVLKHGKGLTDYEDVFIRKDGTFFDVIYSSCPLRERDEVVGLVVVFRDITQRKQAEEALRQAQALLANRAVQLEQAVTERTAELSATNKQLEAFAYSVAHDLRAPVRSMEGFSAMLLEEAGASLSEAGQDFAKRINRAAQFMDALLMDLLTFSSTAQQRIELVPVDLETVVQSVLSRLEKEIQETNARVETSGPWLAVLAHEPTLGQVLFNLVSNALKFVAPDASPVVRVRAEELTGGGPDVFSLSPRGTSGERAGERGHPEKTPPLPGPLLPPASGREGEKPDALEDGESRGEGERLSGCWVRVWVEDEGIGIAPDYQEQIFRLFTRLHGDQYPGTGVGLAIVQKGMERMGGRVGVESKPDQGSRFWFELRRG